ncbi:nitroreductase/quinone reductase family protein [Streptomyces sp. NPDC001617]
MGRRDKAGPAGRHPDHPGREERKDPKVPAHARGARRLLRRGRLRGRGPQAPVLVSQAVEAFPTYAELQKKVDREIPVFVLEPAAVAH